MESGAAVAAIRSALAVGELRPWYQPIVELATGRLVGAEALVRWHRGTGVVEAPNSFLPLAERSDLVLDIDRTILAQALADLVRWQQVRADFRVSVNLSGRHLDQPGLVTEVDAAAAMAGVAPQSIDLEVTETTGPADLEVAAEVLAGLATRGYTIWLDDFGSGWSSLQHLVSLPVGGVKLDRSFASRLGTRMGDAVIAGLATAADRAGFAMILEGIEHASQVEQARALGCRYGQGYHWSRPCPPEELLAMIQNPPAGQVAGGTRT